MFLKKFRFKIMKKIIFTANNANTSYRTSHLLFSAAAFHCFTQAISVVKCQFQVESYAPNEVKLVKFLTNLQSHKIFAIFLR